MIKISLHASGQWRLGSTAQSGITARSSPTGDRAEKKWARPSEFTPGWTQGPSVAVPWTDVKESFPALIQDDKPVHWLSPPAKDESVLVMVLFSAAGLEGDAWRRVTRSGDRLIGNIPLANEEIVWLIARNEAMNDVAKAWVRGRLTTRVGGVPREAVKAVSLFAVAEMAVSRVW